MTAQRFTSDTTENGDAIVLDTNRDPATVVCVCPDPTWADQIADLLNVDADLPCPRCEGEGIMGPMVGDVCPACSGSGVR